MRFSRLKLLRYDSKNYYWNPTGWCGFLLLLCNYIRCKGRQNHRKILRQFRKKIMSKKTPVSVFESAMKNNEPVFVLRAKDSVAEDTIFEYLSRCINAGCSQEHLNGVRKIRDDFIQWKRDHQDQVKRPD